MAREIIEGAVQVANTIEPKNNGSFPVAMADRINLNDGTNVQEKIEELERNGGGGTGGGGTTYKAGENIEITSDGTINVLTTNEAEQDNTKPITSAGCYTIVGNIEALLKTI